MRTKFKSGALIRRKSDGAILQVVGEENDGRKILLNPGGTVKDDIKPTDTEYLDTLVRELEEELSLTSADYYFPDNAIVTEVSAKAATVDMTIHMKVFEIEVDDENKIIPNFIEGDSEHDVYEAVWLKPADFFNHNGELALRDDAELEVINTEGQVSKRLASEYRITALSTEGVIPAIAEHLSEWRSIESNDYKPPIS